MKKRNIFLLVFGSILLFTSLFLFANRDKFHYVGPVEIVEVDCNKKGEILDAIYESDQRVRKPNVPFKQLVKEDHRNQELAISIIEKCGMPTLNEVSQRQMTAIWSVIQHSGKKYRKKYFPQIEEAVKRGDLSKQQYALMKDRILMDEGKPQLYGSQLKNGKLYKLEAPDKVNERRQEMGMKPIEGYLKRNYNIEYKPK